MNLFNDFNSYNFFSSCLIIVTLASIVIHLYLKLLSQYYRYIYVVEIYVTSFNTVYCRPC